MIRLIGVMGADTDDISATIGVVDNYERLVYQAFLGSNIGHGTCDQVRVSSCLRTYIESNIRARLK